MTAQTNIAEAKAKLSSLLDRALAGEEIVIARAGKPLARLVPIGESVRRKPGLLRDWKIPSACFSSRWIPRTSMPPRADTPTSSGFRGRARSGREAFARYACIDLVADRRPPPVRGGSDSDSG
jgi:prevent-host-death family protein